MVSVPLQIDFFKLGLFVWTTRNVGLGQPSFNSKLISNSADGPNNQTKKYISMHLKVDVSFHSEGMQIRTSPVAPG